MVTKTEILLLFVAETTHSSQSVEKPKLRLSHIETNNQTI